MKHASDHARQLRRLYHQLVRKFGKPAAPAPLDPIEQLIIGILAGCTSQGRAHAAFRRLRQQMVDLNELRVTPPSELAAAIDEAVPLAAEKARRIGSALNAIRRRHDSLDLSFLRQRSRREAREYLESLDGVDRAAAASVVLYSLGGHAIPVDPLTLHVLQKDGVVDAAAGLAEVQGFLERHISAAEARAFTELLGRHVNSRTARIPPDRLEALLRPPAPAAPEGVDHQAEPVTAAATPPPAGGQKPAKPAAAKPGPAKPGAPTAKPGAHGRGPVAAAADQDAGAKDAAARKKK